jgi:alpha-N-acetylglucosamine transferase
MNENNCGILYAATGETYIKEAEASARSVRNVMPEIPIAIVTDRQINSDIFDVCIQLDSPEYDFADKILALKETPFRTTIFLDADTYVSSQIKEIFTLLEEFDIAANIATFGHLPPNKVHNRRAEDVSGTFHDSKAFPIYSSGVIAYRMDQNMRDLIEDWYTLYDSDSPIGRNNFGDQEAFTKTLYESDLRLATLPSEYNFAFIDKVQDEIKIFHDPTMDYTDESVINAHEKLLNKQAGYVRVIKKSWNNSFIIVSEKEGSGYKKTYIDSREAAGNVLRYIKHSLNRLVQKTTNR